MTNNANCAYLRALVAGTVAAFLLGTQGTRAQEEVIKGDALYGAAVFVAQCSLCHTIAKGAPNAFGPNLFGITERKAGTSPGYRYSPAFLKVANWTWSPDGVRSFIISPANTIPDNKMAVFQGVADKDLDDVIAYLEQQK
jgi:cytochrome c